MENVATTTTSSSKSHEERSQPTYSESMTRLEWKRALEQDIISGKVAIRLGDLGLVRKLDEKSPINEGESRYCPRELIDLDSHHLDLTKADIFSLSASVYELCLGRCLGSSGEDEMIEWHNIRDGIFCSQWKEKYSSSLTNLIAEMMQEEPSQRPSAKYVKEIAVDQLNVLMPISQKNREDSEKLHLLEMIQKLQAENDQLKTKIG
jgi:serine/threonine protein kinase